MAMIPLERFTIGDLETVQKLNVLVDAVNQLNVMTGDGIIKVLRTPAGIVFNIDRDAISSIGAKAASGAGTGVRKAYMKQNATSGTTDLCFLDRDTIGTEITVNFSISGGSNLDGASPRLADGDLIFVASIGDAWWCLTTFQSAVDCLCEEP